MQVQPVSMNKNIEFYGSVSHTAGGAEYYKTNNGAKVGAVCGGYSLLSNIVGASIEKNPLLIVNGLIVGAMHVGIGTFIDYKRNQKAAEAMDYVKEVGVKQAVVSRDDIYISTKNGKPYYKSNIGAKYGTAIGAGVGALFAVLPSSVLTAAGLGKLKSKELAASGILLFGILTSISALGGFILGKITDHYTNKAAERNA